MKTHVTRFPMLASSGELRVSLALAYLDIYWSHGDLEGNGMAPRSSVYSLAYIVELVYALCDADTDDVGHAAS